MPGTLFEGEQLLNCILMVKQEADEQSGSVNILCFGV